MSNLFAQAKLATAVASSTSSEKVVEGVKLLAQMQAVLTAINSMYATIENEVKEAAKELYIKEGLQSKSQPDNFDITEDNCSANYQMRKRSTRSVLKDAELKLLTDNNIPFEMAVVQKEMFTINPAYTNNQELLQKISDKISRIPDLPSDFILYVPEESKPVTTSESITEVFSRVSDASKIRELLNVVGVQALRVRSDNGDISEAFDIISSMIE